MIDRRVTSGGNFLETKAEENRPLIRPALPDQTIPLRLSSSVEQRPLVSIADLQARLRQEAGILQPQSENNVLKPDPIPEQKEKFEPIKQEIEQKKIQEKTQGWLASLRKNSLVQKVTRTVAALGIMATAMGIIDTPQFAKETPPSQPITASGSFLPPLEESGYAMIPDPFVPVLAKNNFIVERQHIQEETGQQLIEIFPETKKELIVEIKEGDTLLGVLEANGYSVDDLGATIVANKDQIAINATPNQREALEQVDSSPTTFTQKAWSWAKKAGERIFAGQKITLEKAHR